MAGYCEVLFISVNRNTQKKPTSSPGKGPWGRGWKNAWPTFIHLDRTSLVNEGYIVWRKAGPTRENSERASRVANQNAGFASSCSLADSRNTGNIFAQLVAQHCCIASWKALLPVWPPSLPTCHATNFDVASCGNMLRKVDPNSAFCNKLSIL